MSAPLILIAASGLPALLISVWDTYNAQSLPGTLSFRQGLSGLFKQSLIISGMFVGSATAWALYIVIAFDPKPRRDQRVWLFGVTMVACYFGAGPSRTGMNPDGVLLFRTLPSSSVFSRSWVTARVGSRRARRYKDGSDVQTERCSGLLLTQSVPRNGHAPNTVLPLRWHTTLNGVASPGL